MHSRPTHCTPTHCTLVLLLSIGLPALAHAWHGEAIAVFSGDTLTVLYNVRHVQIQLHGVDTPDRKQPLGKEARRLCSRLARKKRVKVRPYGTDANRRVLARIYIGKRCLNEELLRAGLARWVKTGTAHDKKLQKLEAAARKAKKGIWGLDR